MSRGLDALRSIAVLAFLNVHQVHLLDRPMLELGASFFTFVSVWLMKLVDPENRGLPFAEPR